MFAHFGPFKKRPKNKDQKKDDADGEEEDWLISAIDGAIRKMFNPNNARATVALFMDI